MPHPGERCVKGRSNHQFCSRGCSRMRHLLGLKVRPRVETDLEAPQSTASCSASPLSKARAMSSAKAETDRRWPLNRERDRQRLRRRSRRWAGRDDNSSLRDCVKRHNSGNRHATFDHSNEIVRSDMMLVEEGKKIKFVFCYFRRNCTTQLATTI